jgi:predicted small integral membrane protein
MSHFLPLFSQSAIVALQAAWLTLAVHENIRHPEVNARAFFAVLSLQAIKRHDAAVYRRVAYRRIASPKARKRLFRLLLGAEIVVTILLWIAALALLAAAIGLIGAVTANILANFAVLSFTVIWACFLVGGEWFLYWIGMPRAQQVHFFLILWGIATLTYLAAAS